MAEVREPLFVDCKVETHGKHDPMRVVIHTTESHDYPGRKDIYAIPRYWREQGRGLGAHLIIDKHGQTGKCAPFDRITWAVKNANTGSIHIELIGFARFSPQLWWARVDQLNKAARWLAYLNKEYGIPLVHSCVAGVAGHREVPGNDHTDPGRWFPMKYLIRKAKVYADRGW